MRLPSRNRTSRGLVFLFLALALGCSPADEGAEEGEAPQPSPEASQKPSGEGAAPQQPSAPSGEPSAPAGGAADAAWSEGDPQAGKTVYAQNCASCHGPEGKGEGPLAAGLPVQPRSFVEANFKFDTNGDGKAGTPEDLANVIRNGAAKYGGSAQMAPWGHLGDEKIRDLVAYVRSFSN